MATSDNYSLCSCQWNRNQEMLIGLLSDSSWGDHQKSWNPDWVCRKSFWQGFCHPCPDRRSSSSSAMCEQHELGKVTQVLWDSLSLSLLIISERTPETLQGFVKVKHYAKCNVPYRCKGTDISFRKRNSFSWLRVISKFPLPSTVLEHSKRWINICWWNVDLVHAGTQKSTRTGSSLSKSHVNTLPYKGVKHPRRHLWAC